MIFSRCESLIDKGMNDVLRCKAYLQEGSDGIMIPRKSNGAEILEFCEHYKNFGVDDHDCCPILFDKITETEFEKAG